MTDRKTTRRFDRPGCRAVPPALQELRKASRGLVLLRTAALISTGLLLSGCVFGASPQAVGPVTLRTPDSFVTQITVADEQAATIAVTQALFERSPLVVVSDSAEAAEVAADAGIPVLAASLSADADGSTSSADPRPTPGTVADSGPLLAEVERLQARRVVVVGDGRLDLPPSVDVDTVAGTAELTAALESAPTAAVRDTAIAAVLGPSGANAVAAAAARAGGAQIIRRTSEGGLLEASDVITALTELQPDQTLLIGGDVPPSEADWTVRAAMSGFQLPGGGQRLFGGRRYVALYGTPGTSALGILGEQDVPETIARARSLAADYEPLSDLPIVPTLEIIATVAAGEPGADGDYSNELDPSRLEPLIDAAAQAGMYVVLDLQPGRSDFLSQAQAYESLLTRPNVGLALDPEWRLRPDQVHLRQIGSVDAVEVNAVSDWLQALVQDHGLPPKMLIVHQFRLSMITDRASILTNSPQVELLVHVDGQGAPADKLATWRAVIDASPAGAATGWKNFYDEDRPMLSPMQTMSDVTPTPDFISYQ